MNRYGRSQKSTWNICKLFLLIFREERKINNKVEEGEWVRDKEGEVEERRRGGREEERWRKKAKVEWERGRKKKKN